MNDHQFTRTDLDIIEQMAEGLSRDEICSWFSLDYEALNEEQKDLFDRAWRRGRANIIFYSLRKLKAAMDGKNATQACLATLTQFGSQWENVQKVPNVRAFKISLDDL